MKTKRMKIKTMKKRRKKKMDRYLLLKMLPRRLNHTKPKLNLSLFKKLVLLSRHYA